MEILQRVNFHSGNGHDLCARALTLNYIDTEFMRNVRSVECNVDVMEKHRRRRIKSDEAILGGVSVAE